MVDLTVQADAFANGQFSGNPPNSGVQVTGRPLVDFVLDQGGSLGSARILLVFDDADVMTGDVDDDTELEQFVVNGTRIQSFQIDLDGDGTADFDVRGQNPNDLDLNLGGQEGDNIARLNGSLRIFEAGTDTQVDQLPSMNLFIANDGGFPPPGGVKPIVDQGSGTFTIGDPNNPVFPCFVTGTPIWTGAEFRPIEDFRVGDPVWTADHGCQPIRWIGRRSFTAQDLVRRPELRPVRIGAGALGNAEAILVSRQHRMLITSVRAALMFDDAEVLAPAHALINGTTIDAAAPEAGVTYIHLLFDRHEIVNACGALSESFHPGDYIVGASASATRDELFRIFPDLLGGPQFAKPARPVLTIYESRALMRADG